MITRAEITFVKSLERKRKRIESGFFVIEGPKLLEEALAVGVKPHKVYATKEHLQFSKLTDFQTVNQNEIERMSTLRSPQGVIAVVPIPNIAVSDNIGKQLTLILDGVQDPGNLGTIIRIADWFGIREIVCSPETADCYNSKVVQATMGAIFRVNVHYAGLEPILKDIGDRGINIYGTFLEGDNIYDTTLNNEGVVVLGSEGSGISPNLEKLINRKLFIPPYPADKPSVESLNVAVATAIICSEFRRR